MEKQPLIQFLQDIILFYVIYKEDTTVKEREDAYMLLLEFKEKLCGK